MKLLKISLYLLVLVFLVSSSGFADELFLREKQTNRMIRVEPGFEVMVYAFDHPHSKSGRWYSGTVSNVENYDGGGYLHLPKNGLAFCNIDPEVSKVLSRTPIQKAALLTERSFKSLKEGILGYESIQDWPLLKHFLCNGIVVDESELPRVGFLLNLIKRKIGFQTNSFLWATFFASFEVQTPKGTIQLYDYWEKYRESSELEIPSSETTPSLAIANQPMAGCPEKLEGISNKATDRNSTSSK